MERTSVSKLEVMVALVDDGAPIQSEDPTPRILILRMVVELGQ